MTAHASSTPEGAAIETTGLAKTYGRGAHALAAVRPTTLSVPWGQVIGLLGPNGAGKTTIIKMICGLITPTAGTIRLAGYDVAGQRSRAVRRIGAVLEGSRNVYWPLSAWENLMYFGRLKGLRGAEIKPRARRLLTDLGLWERRDQPVGSYSRGMQQKVAVSAALINDPPIILLDEPTLGLDVQAARTFKDWITHLARDEGKTIVLTTHQLEVAQELSDRIAVIRAGEIIADLPTAELLSRHAENRYEIRLDGGHPGAIGDGILANATIETTNGHTRIVLPTTDQDHLHTVLNRLHARELDLLSVDRVRPSLEEVFLHLIHDGAPSSGGTGAVDAKEPVS